MSSDDRLTYVDILRQGETLSETLDRLEQAPPPDGFSRSRSFVFTGCGSSYYAAEGAARLLSALADVHATAAPASELWLVPELYLREDSVVIGVSRTGTTTEVVRALEQARGRGLATGAISLGVGVPLYDLADFRLELSHVGERGRVMTQSFSNLLLAGQWLALQAGGRAAQAYTRGLRAAVDAVAALLPALDERARAVARRGHEQYVMVGSGPIAPLCAEVVLKIKEMTQLPSESYAALEYRHGPIAGLTATSLVSYVSTPRSSAFDAIGVGDAHLLGADALVAGPAAALAGLPDTVESLVLPDGLPDWLYGNVALPFFQLLAYHRTVELGANPEAVRNLDKHTDPHVDPHVVGLALADV